MSAERSLHSVSDTYRHLGVEYGSERPCEIARIQREDGNVTLAFRYLDEDGEWFPTWTGTVGNAVKVPRGWRFTREWLEIIEGASLIKDVRTLSGASCR